MNKAVITIFAGALLVSGFLLWNANKVSDEQFSSLPKLSLAPDVLAERFDYLAEQRTNSCGGDKNYVAQLSANGTRLQGSCCSPMDFHSYQEQVEGLQKYSEYEIIPPDPYDVSAQWADSMMKYNEETELNPEQQAIYDKAMGLSYEGGPCCCLCWRWYAFGGLAKYLIINYDFSAEQIAEVWDLSDGCGGEHQHHEN